MSYKIQRIHAGFLWSMWLIQFIWQSINWFRLKRRQSTSQSDSSKNKKLKSIVEVVIWGKRHVDGLHTKRGSATICTALSGSHFLPSAQPFTSDSYRAIEHSRGTSTSLTSATKSILKLHSPQFPHYFTCQNAHRTVEEVQIPLRGATAHLLPASAPLKMLLVLRRNEYIINLHHLLSQTTILSPGSQRRLLLWRALPRAERETWKRHSFMEQHSRRKRMSHIRNDPGQINTDQLSI